MTGELELNQTTEFDYDRHKPVGTPTRRASFDVALFGAIRIIFVRRRRYIPEHRDSRALEFNRFALKIRKWRNIKTRKRGRGSVKVTFDPYSKEF